MHHHAVKPNDSMLFFTVVGIVCLIFGCLVPLFNMMFSPLLSALFGLAFMLIGGVCSMMGVGAYLHGLDEAYFQGTCGTQQNQGATDEPLHLHHDQCTHHH